MKKRYLKEWVQYLLILCQLFNICILAAECNKLWLFIVSKIIALIMMIIIHIIFKRWTTYYE